MKPLCNISTDYDIEALVRSGKRALTRAILLIMLYALLLIGSALVVAFCHSCLPAFIIGVSVGCVMLFLLLRQIKKLHFADYSSACGEIADVLKEMTTVRSITGGYGMYVTRKYDAFAKEAVRLTVSIESGEEIYSYVLDRVTEEHAKYYETKGKVVHMWGTHFPVKLEIGKKLWLCPVCGEFNVNEEKTCARCKRKILK